MMMRTVWMALACLLVPGVGSAQDGRLKLPEFNTLAGKATESVNISLSPWLLHMAGAMISDKDADGASPPSACWPASSPSKVRSYEFATDNAYSASDNEYG